MTNGCRYYIDDDNRLDFRYRIVDVGMISSNEIREHPNQQLRAFLPLVDRKRRKREKVKFLQACVQDIMAANLPLEEKKMVLLRAEIFSGLVFEGDIIETIFKGVEDMLNLEESAGYRRIYEKGKIKGELEGEKKGEEKGEKKGEKRGEKKGEVKGKQEAAQKFLARRFGEQSVDIQEKVKGLTDLEVLNNVLPELFSVNTLEEARSVIQEGLRQSLPEKKVPKT
ncbi:MAG TPA: hypothetical protein VMW83_04505 [Spirochaetia bacterium]|nr:hypothetical protein [Spirochaetia bacterium]